SGCQKAPDAAASGARSCWWPLAAAAASQLLPERGQRLVRGQRAAGVGGSLGGVGAATGGVHPGGLGVGPASLLDLLAVRVVAGLRLGVLPLPVLALLLVPRQPVPGLRVEALRVDVVAVLVVLGLHAVRRRVELLRGALVGLLQREADPAPLQ